MPGIYRPNNRPNRHTNRPNLELMRKVRAEGQVPPLRTNDLEGHPSKLFLETIFLDTSSIRSTNWGTPMDRNVSEVETSFGMG
jgi:hypothetical protein